MNIDEIFGSLSGNGRFIVFAESKLTGNRAILRNTCNIIDQRY